MADPKTFLPEPGADQMQGTDTTPAHGVTLPNENAPVAQGPGSPSGPMPSTEVTGAPQPTLPANIAQGQTQPMPVQGQPQAAPQKPLLEQDHQTMFHTLFQALAGGPKTSYKINANTGEMEKTETPLGKGGISAGILAGAVTGLFKGMGQTGPNAAGKAAQAGFEAGTERAQTQQKVQKEQATQDYARKLAVTDTNMKMYANAIKFGQEGLKENEEYVKDHAAQVAEAMAHPDQILGSGIPHSDFAKYNVTDNNAIPMSVIERTDPGTGQPVLGKGGEKQYDVLYMVMKPNAPGVIDPETAAYATKLGLPGFVNSKGEALNLPQNAAVKLHTSLAIQSQLQAAKQTTRNVSDYFKKLNTNAVNPEAQKSIFDIYNGSIPDLANAIAKREGFGGKDTNNRPNRNHNPGDLKTTNSAQPHDADGFRIFPSNEEGQAALENDILAKQNRNPNATPAQFVDMYLGNDAKETPAKHQEYTNHLYKEAGMETPGAPAPGQEKFKPVDVEAAIRARPSLINDIQKWQAYGNNGQSLPKAFEEFAKKDPDAAGRVAPLYGGYEALKAADDQEKYATAGALDRQRKGDTAAVNNQKKIDNANEKNIEMNQTAMTLAGPNAMLGDYEKLFAARSGDRPKLLQALRDIDPEFSEEAYRRKGNVSKEFASTEKANSAGSQIRSLNTFASHVQDALEAEQAFKNSPSNISELFNKKGINWWKKNMSNDPNFAKLQAALQPVSDEYSNLLKSGHAMTQAEQEQLHEMLNDATTPARAIAIMHAMVPTVAGRAGAIDQQWMTAFKGAHYPNLIAPENVQAFASVTDPRLRRMISPMQSGGTFEGRADGTAGPGGLGKSVGESLGWTPSQAPQQQAQAKQAAPKVAEAPAGASQEVIVNGKLAGHIVNNTYQPLGQGGQ